ESIASTGPSSWPCAAASVRKRLPPRFHRCAEASANIEVARSRDQPKRARVGQNEGAMEAITAVIALLPARPVVSVTTGATADTGIVKMISLVHQARSAAPNSASDAKM